MAADRATTPIRYTDRRGKKQTVKADPMEPIRFEVDGAERIEVHTKHGPLVITFGPRDVEISGTDLFTRQVGADTVTIRF